MYYQQVRNNKKTSIKKCASNAPVAASLGNRLWNIITTYYIGSNCPLCNTNFTIIMNQQHRTTNMDHST